jgi:hypothetical protein
LLRQIGDFGILLCKDLTSMLAQNRDTRAAVLAALREIHDGSWTRHVGTDGGRTLHWSGKVGLLAGCTPTIDLHHGVIATMGERFTLYRLPASDPERVAEYALSHIGREQDMRAEMTAAVRHVLDKADPGCKPANLSDAEQDRLSDLAEFAVRCRSAVERDGYSHEVVMAPEPESPARLVTVLRYLLHGMSVIGVPERDRWRLLAKVASDCMPAVRWSLLQHLSEYREPVSTTDIAMSVGMPTPTVRRYLEDLTLLGATDRTKSGAAANAADKWALTPWARVQWPSDNIPTSASESQQTA